MVFSFDHIIHSVNCIYLCKIFQYLTGSCIRITVSFSLNGAQFFEMKKPPVRSLLSMSRHHEIKRPEANKIKKKKKKKKWKKNVAVDDNTKSRFCFKNKLINLESAVINNTYPNKNASRQVFVNHPVPLPKRTRLIYVYGRFHSYSEH